MTWRIHGVEQNAWHNDQLTSIDVMYMNHREITALSNTKHNV